MEHKPADTRADVSPLLPVTAGALAVAIFAVDAITSLDIAIAVLYVVVVLMAANALDRRGVLLVAAGCLALTVLAYLLGHGLTTSTALGRFVMSVAAIGITTFLALKNQSANLGLREQARLLDLTHDTIFVRDMNDVITYWNRGAEVLYGWRSEQAVGKACHQLMHTSFPEPPEAITAQLLDAGRWEGELTHTRRDGTQVVVASRWTLQRDDRGRPVAILETNNDITDRKAAEQRLRKAERELSLTIDTIPALVLSAWPDGTPDFINARWTEQGFSEHDLRSGLSAVVHPDDLPEIAQKRSRSLVTGEPYQAEVRLRKASGEYRWYLAQAVTLRDETGRVVKRYAMATGIEDRKRADQSLRRAEKELRTTIDTIPALVLSAWPDGTMDFINARWAEQGFCEQDLLSDWSALVHPDDLPELTEKRQRSLATGDFYEAEARFRRIDGEYRWFLIRALSLRDETGQPVKRYATATDIEDRKRAEDALRRSEALLAETQELTRTGSVGYDAVTGEVFWSAEGARIFGYDPSIEPTLELLVQRVHPDDVWLARRSIERTNRGEPDDAFDIRLVMPDGAVKYVHAVSHAVRDASARRALRALMDVTAVREAEAALHRAQAELAHATRMTALGELTASIAHEVNQPLAAIVTNGQACLRWLGREVPHLDEARGAVKRIVGDADRASEVILRLRALSQKAEPQKAALNLNEVIDEVVLLVRREVQSHRVSLQLDLAPDLPAVRADRVQLQQVLINLVINAIQAMAPVTDRPRELLLRSHAPEAGRVLVAVQDSGTGIEPEHQSRLFDTFFTTKPGGVGMGLSISIVEAHGGEVWATANAGPGATFQFTLPANLRRG
jgi:PAS domain S-box-containing protein